MAKKGERKRPALTFYPKEWIWDIELRQCSPAARGLWIDLMCIMHDGVPYGHLTAPDDLVLRMIGMGREEYAALLSELEEVRLSGKSVAYRSAEGLLFSKRMVLDEEDRIRRKENGRTGGNPRLTEDSESSDNQGMLSEHEKKRIEEKKEKIKEVDAWFESEFWPTYPKKADKPHALNSARIKGKTPEARAAIMTGLRAQLLTLRAWKDKGVCPNPGTWLNGERWNDEATPGPSMQPTPASAPASVVSTMDPELRRELDERRRNG